MADATPSCYRTPETSRRRRFGLALLVLLCWLIAASTAFYSFEFQPLRPFQQTASPELSAYPVVLESLLPAEATGRATVIHVLDPACDCLRYTRPHLVALQAEPVYQSADHILVSPSLAGPAVDSVKPAARFQVAALASAIRSPAVAVFDEHQKLSYYGPYSLGPACGRAGDVVIPVLTAIELGTPAPEYELTARTCFCDPPSQFVSAFSSAGGATAQ